MTRDRARLAAFLAAVALLLGFGPARACQCITPIEPAASFAQADAVFLGVVMSIEDPNSANTTRSTADPLYVRMRVLKSWKAAPDSETVVTIAAGSSSCGFTFKPGLAYLVYAGYHENPSDTLHVSLCSGTRDAWDARDHYAALGKPERDHTNGVYWGNFQAVPYCEVHPQFVLKTDVRTFTLARSDCVNMYEAAMQRDFPHAALRLTKDRQGWTGADGPPVKICAGCQRAAYEWLRSSGCLEP